MRVLLADAPAVSQFSRTEAETAALREHVSEPSLGILTLAAILRNRFGTTPEVIETNSLYYEYLDSDCADFATYAAEIIAQRHCEVAGFSSMCSSYPTTLRIAKRLKEICPRVTLVLGGPQASAVAAETIARMPFIDIIVRGEADGSFPDLLHKLAAGQDISSVPGLVFRNAFGVVATPEPPPVADLDEVPLPAYDLIPHPGRAGFLPLELGRGCPFACTFCSTNDFFRRKFRLKSPERVLAQMREVRERFGIDSFGLVHDMFTVDRRKVLAFCETMRRSGDRFRWACSARTDFVDEELLQIMAASGCTGLFFGIESGSPEIQKEIDKGLDLDEALRHIRSAARKKIETDVSLIIGFPTETWAQIDQSVRFLAESLRERNARPQMHVLAPLAGTPFLLQYRDRMSFDGVYSDFSHQGWYQSDEDRQLITRHFELFPNFFSLPSTLDRSRVKALQLFLNLGMARFRWLLVALHQEFGLLAVFHRWYDAAREDGVDFTNRYFSGMKFPRDLCLFIRQRLLEDSHTAEATRSVVEYVEACAQERVYRTRPVQNPLLGNSVSVSSVAVPVHNFRVLRLTYDLGRVLECLSTGQSVSGNARARHTVAAFTVSGSNTFLYSLGTASEAMLRLSAEHLKVGALLQRFHQEKIVVPGIDSNLLATATLASLRREQLIVFEGPSEGKTLA